MSTFFYIVDRYIAAVFIYCFIIHYACFSKIPILSETICIFSRKVHKVYEEQKKKKNKIHEKKKMIGAACVDYYFCQNILPHDHLLHGETEVCFHWFSGHLWIFARDYHHQFVLSLFFFIEDLVAFAILSETRPYIRAWQI